MELIDQVSPVRRSTASLTRQVLYVAVCSSEQEGYARLETILRRVAAQTGRQMNIAQSDSVWGIRGLVKSHHYDLVFVNETDLSPACGDTLLALESETLLSGFTTESNPALKSSPQMLRCMDLEHADTRIIAQLERLMATAIQRRRQYILNQTRTLVLQLHQIMFGDLKLEPLLQVCLEQLTQCGYVDAEAETAVCLLYPGARAMKVAAGLNLDQQSQQRIEAGLNLALSAEGDTGEHLLLSQLERVGKSSCFIPVYDSDRLLAVLMFHTDSHFDVAELSLTATDEIAAAVRILVTSHRERERVDRVYQQNNQLIQSISSAIVGVDIYDCISHWNRSAEHYLGLSSEEVLGRSIMSLPLEWSWAHISLHVLTCLTEKVSTERFEAPYTNASGKAGVFSIVITPLLDERGNFGGYLMLLDDITTKVEAEKKAQQDERLQSIGQLAAGIAHEINTPIQYVGDNLHFLRDAFTDVAQVTRHCSDWVLSQPPGPEASRLQTMISELELEYLMEEVPQAVQQALDGVDHVSRIVRAMKDFSHPGSDEKVDTDINRIIQTTITITRNIWKHFAELKLDLDQELPLIKTYPGPLSEVLLNLIVNASDAIQEVVDEADDSNGELCICSGLSDGWLEVTVSDSGSGVPEAAQPFIFDPFFTTKPVGKGTGQGLSISHKVIEEQHGGSLTFRTEPGKGSCFIIRLPLDGSDCDDSTEEATHPVSG